MHATLRLLSQLPKPALPLHVTLFTRAQCGPCAVARETLAKVWEKRPFEYRQVDIMEDPDVGKWREVYKLKVPVVHVAKTAEDGEHGNARPEKEEGRGIKRMMYPFSEEDILGAMQDVLPARREDSRADSQ